MNTFSSLKRTANIRSRKHGIFTKKSEPLQIIVEEEEEPHPSCSSSKQRKQFAVSPSDIRIAKTPLEDAFDCDTLLSEPPRPAPRPPSTSPTSSASSSPAGSPDSFRLTFTDASFKFPHPPIPTPSSSSWSPMPSPRSPRSPSSSPISSPSSQGTPLTPSSSDDECDAAFRLAPAPTGFGLKRLRSIKPLVIVKHGRSQSAPAPSGPLPSLPTENAELEADIEFFRAPKMFAASPLPSSTGSSHSESDEEEEVSDSEWYSRDISRLLTLRSVLPPAFPKRISASAPAPASSTLTAPTPTLRPESLCACIHVPPSPTKAGGYPSAQLDPDFPKRRSYLYPIPTRPPPPVPSSPVSPVTPSSVPATPITPATPVLASSTSTGSSRRRTHPPPRMSIPHFDHVHQLMWLFQLGFVRFEFGKRGFEEEADSGGDVFEGVELKNTKSCFSSSFGFFGLLHSFSLVFLTHARLLNTFSCYLSLSLAGFRISYWSNVTTKSPI
ncbi:hypothetical protein D9758_006969 [Tetrapyrgos nigripes]|uniref:Uncharacterized protein n=1 Tax=Tetrapyrgos nigripes TaxID=182062 RepID=A0A8H5GSD9_9AGAR|nr:hypothetical protein D9758_006969 [Tetrapyrgos nigripes]